MNRLLALLLALFAVSCSPYHTVVMPLANPAGVPVAIEIPGVPAGEEAKASQVMEINETLLEDIDEESVARKYISGFDPKTEGLAVGADGLQGTLTTKNGKKFAGYAAILSVRGTRSPAEIESAAQRIAADVYRKASRKYRVHSMNELQKAR